MTTMYPDAAHRFGGNTTDNQVFYTKVFGWVALALGLAAFSAMFLGPLIPVSFLMPMYIITLIALFAAGFSRKAMNPTISGAFAIIIPLILGAVLYPTLNHYISTGQGDIVSSAAAGTALIFGGMAVWGWTSKKNLNSWLPAMFFILLGLIGVSLLNVFVFQLTGLSFVISLVAVVLFAIYTFIDIQMVKNRTMDAPPSFYALNLFLNIYNLFISLLNILGILSD